MNWHIFFVGAIALIMQNNYFGWNFTPKSDAELISDCIILAIFSMSFLRVAP